MRGGIRQLRKTDQVLLVLGRHETGGHRLEHEDRRPRPAAAYTATRQGFAFQDAIHATLVLDRGAAEKAVEPAEEAAEHLVHAAGQRVFRRVVRFQQRRGQGRRQGQRAECRDHGRDGDGQRELAVELAGQAGHEGDRHEHGAQHQGDGDDRTGLTSFMAWMVASREDSPLRYCARRFPPPRWHHRRRYRSPAPGRTATSVLIEKPKAEHHGEGADDRHRHGDQRDDGGAPGLQEHDHHQHHQGDSFQQRVDDRLDRFADELGGVVHHAVSLRLPGSPFSARPSWRARRLDSCRALASRALRK